MTRRDCKTNQMIFRGNNTMKRNETSSGQVWRRAHKTLEMNNDEATDLTRAGDKLEIV